jgi:hypothetical protein
MKNLIQNLISVLVLLVLIGLSVLSFTSCSIEHHLSKSQKHKDTAIRKGAVIKPDTVWHHTYSTELVFDSSRNAYFEKTIIKDSFPYLVTNTISAGMTRQERKALEAEFKHLEKMMKLQNDSLAKQLKALTKINGQNQKTERVIIRQESKPWMWIAISMISLVILAALILINKFIKR